MARRPIKGSSQGMGIHSQHPCADCGQPDTERRRDTSSARGLQDQQADRMHADRCGTFSSERCGVPTSISLSHSFRAFWHTALRKRHAKECIYKRSR